MKVAIVHYWLIGMRGGEKVLEDICDIYPDADIFTHVYNKKNISNKINKHNIYTTFINHLPFSKTLYKYYLPLMPLSLKLISFKKYDIIISSESGPAKGVRKNINTFHVCYCHSPMRYIWDFYDDYYTSLSFFGKLGLRFFKNYLRKWDAKSSSNIDLIISNSTFVSKRINKYWNKDSTVIHPGIDLNCFSLSNQNKDYYLVLSELIEYKKIDLVVNAFNINKKKILIIGKGPLYNKLFNISNKNIKFLGWQTDEKKSFYLSNCKALIFPGVEDFGIVPIESMASGRPVLAFNQGGVLDYIQKDINGMFFNKQTVESLNHCIEQFEIKENKFIPEKIRDSISSFSNINFKNKFKDIIMSNYKNDQK